MELIDRILSDGNIEAAIHAVKSNRGAAGIDKMTVDALEGYFAEHGKEIKEQIRAKKYQPQPVRRVYIPKANGKQRPLGIPTVVDRVIQQAVAQVLSRGYERYFSEYSYGFRPNRDCHKAIEKVLDYLNMGCEWVVVILKQWKKPRTIQRNLSRLNAKLHCNMTDEDIYKTANSRLGWYGMASGNVVNFLLSPKVLSLPNKKENRPGLVDPLAYYLGYT